MKSKKDKAIEGIIEMEEICERMKKRQSQAKQLQKAKEEIGLIPRKKSGVPFTPRKDFPYFKGNPERAGKGGKKGGQVRNKKKKWASFMRALSWITDDNCSDKWEGLIGKLGAEDDVAMAVRMVELFKKMLTLPEDQLSAESKIQLIINSGKYAELLNYDLEDVEGDKYYGSYE